VLNVYFELMPAKPQLKTSKAAIPDQFVADIRDAKKEKRLHSWVEERLSGLLKNLYPDSYPVPEVGGVLGGRNDLIQFFQNGRRVVFELFATVRQVSQDLRLLEQSSAQVKIAILLDEQVNPKLANEYFHKKPDHFPFIRLSEVVMPGRELACLDQLREIIESHGANELCFSVGVFDKRLAEYESLRTLLRMSHTSNLAHSDSHQRFQMCSYEFRQRKDAFVLTFGNDPTVIAYVDGVHEKCVDLCHVNYRLYLSNRTAVGEERSKLYRQEKDLTKWFYDQCRGGLRETFSKHLSLK
jgi:hypothetical protein